jgi:rubrerythrin
MARLIKVDDIKWESTQNGGWERPYEYVTKQDIDRMPAVDAVEVVHGRWKDAFGGKYENPKYICSVCKNRALYTAVLTQLGNWRDEQDLSNYCPNCGARMDLEVKDA